jgi:hypothetical protein
MIVTKGLSSMILNCYFIVTVGGELITFDFKGGLHKLCFLENKNFNGNNELMKQCQQIRKKCLYICLDEM